MAEYRQATNGDIANMAGSVRVVCALDECEQLGQYIVECMPMLVMEYTDGRRQCRLVPSFEVEVDHSLGAVEVTGYLPLLGDLFHCLVHERGMR